MNQRKLNGLMIFLFLSSIAGIIVSYTLIEEDVLSTALTLFEYLPSRYGVRPAVEWEGAVRLGIFTTVAQIISGAIMGNKSIPKFWRWVAGIMFVVFMPIDYFTDVVHRSAYFTGNLPIAVVTTMIYYTLGSEMLQAASWVMLFMTWRVGIRELLWALTNVVEVVSNLGNDWRRMRGNANSVSQRELNEQMRSMGTGGIQNTSYQPRSSSASNQPVLRPASQMSPRPAPKPVSRQTSFVPPEPTYHPLSYDNKPQRGGDGEPF